MGGCKTYVEDIYQLFFKGGIGNLWKSTFVHTSTWWVHSQFVILDVPHVIMVFLKCGVNLASMFALLSKSRQQSTFNNQIIKMDHLKMGEWVSKYSVATSLASGEL